MHCQYINYLIMFFCHWFFKMMFLMIKNKKARFNLIKSCLRSNIINIRNLSHTEVFLMFYAPFWP
ncbi:hypothetical protein HA44_15510 [Mixta gaviniae]|nr:hypothetical protein HA44_15510 [Mixta gaviniae]